MDIEDHPPLKEYIATFWTHLAALQTLNRLHSAGIEASARPVPRALSSSCGTCVRFFALEPCTAFMHRDFEQIVAVVNGTYEKVAENDASL
ncbi:MAG: DUF3343 domain-containing protein [Eubacteriales bacterium]|nr:DUF3343 domain-containing protein [Eubacteriales bacterium]